MTQTDKKQKPKAKKAQKPAPQPEPSRQDRLADRAVSFWLQFDRFGWDILGLVVITGALISLMALAGLARGAFMIAWAAFLRQWLGWGSFLVILSIGAMGLLAIRRLFANLPQLHVGRIIALEGLIFTILALLAVFGGQSLNRAEEGLDGGKIGWALAKLVNTALPSPLHTLFLLLLAFIFFMAGFGLFKQAFALIEKWVEQEESAHPYAPIPVAPAPVQSAPDEPDWEADDEEETAPPQKQRGRLPPLKTQAPVTGLPRPSGLPPLNLLQADSSSRPDAESIHETARLLERTLAEFSIPARVVGYRVGPTVTQFAVEPGFLEKPGPEGDLQRQKVRVSQISALGRDLARALSAERLRIEAPVPGQSFVGIEVPNRNAALVRLRPIIDSPLFYKVNSPLAIGIGIDVSGQPMVADLGRMPHLLVAGTTGSGKSVCIAALTICLAMNNSPADLRMAMLDPKMVELIRFNGLPHLFGKVETQPDRMIGVLKWAIAEMDSRYRLLEAARARNLDTYNKRMERKKQTPLPRIVILIDELADLMMAAPDQTEHSIVRLAQLARATGIHLIVATQRPSTDVITGLIKANFPARIAFSVASSIDSRVILDSNGAESLLGRGDLLFLNPEVGSPLRAQGAMVTDHEIERVIDYWKKMAPKEEDGSPWENLIQSEEAGPDSMIDEAVKIVRRTQRASASMLQRRLRVGYPRAARLIDELEEMGVIGPAQVGGREREVLVPPEDGEEDEGENGENGGGQ